MGFVHNEVVNKVVQSMIEKLVNISVEDFERQLECAMKDSGSSSQCVDEDKFANNMNAVTSPSDLYDTFYEARWINSVGRPMHTYIWEFEGQTHRELLRSDIFMVSYFLVLYITIASIV